MKEVIDATILKIQAEEKIDIDERMRLQVSVDSLKANHTKRTGRTSSDVVDDSEMTDYHALNEVTISREQNDYMVQFEIFVNDVLLTVVFGDGYDLFC